MGKSKKYKIYSVDYLANNDLTEEDLHYIFDTSSFKYSLVVNMFRHAGEKNKTDADIINICKTDENWVYKNYWTKKERASFLKKIIQVFKNVYQYSLETAKGKAEWFLFRYGLSIKGNNLIS